EDLSPSDAEQLSGDPSASIAAQKGYQLGHVTRRYLERTFLVTGLRVICRLDQLGDARRGKRHYCITRHPRASHVHGHDASQPYQSSLGTCIGSLSEVSVNSRR